MTANTIQNFEIWVEIKKKIRVDMKKKNASRVRETADQLSCQSIFNIASIPNGVSLASKYRRIFFLVG